MPRRPLAPLASPLDPIDSPWQRRFCPATPVLIEGRSSIAGVAILSGGRALRVGRNGSFTNWAYETLAPQASATLSDAADELRRALAGAVRARVATGCRLTADFSGGLDSTSVAFLAAGYTPGPLRVFSYHHPDAPAGDVEYATRFASLDSRIRLEVVHGGPDTLTYRSLVSPGGEAPDFAAVSWARTSLRLRRIAATGGGVNLGGEGADAMLAVSPTYLADLASHRMIRRLGTEAACSRGRGVSRRPRSSHVQSGCRGRRLAWPCGNSPTSFIVRRIGPRPGSTRSHGGRRSRRKVNG